jgi:histidinol phosphatase-like enzyme
MKRVLVDFDGTIIKKSSDGKFRVFDGVRESLRQMKANGYEIVIFTSRLADPRDEKNRENSAIISNFLSNNKIPFDRITAEKTSADYYIDDKAISFKGNWSDVIGEMK